MYVQLIEVPYDSGHWGTRMGRGPGALVAAGLPEILLAEGHAVERERVQPVARFPTEIATGFAVAGGIARAVRAAAWHSRFPLVLMGNCLGSVGVAAGLPPGETGVVWLDAHADFNTPESSPSGFLDGMALSTLTGQCWAAARENVPGFHPVAPENVVLVGARDLDPGEEPRLSAAGVTRVAPGRVLDDLPAALDRVLPRVKHLYLHLDLDVLDPSVGRANGFAAEGGLTVEELHAALDLVRERGALSAAGISAYDPAYDPAGTVRAAALRAAMLLLKSGGT
jgi:arginase